MTPTLRAVLAIAVCMAAPRISAAQAIPTASRPIQLSVFAGATALETRIEGGKNLGITAGFDISFRPGKSLQPSLEYRGTYPIDKGTIDSQKNNLLGVKLATRPRFKGLAKPYLALFYGRGEINYANDGLQVPGKPIYYTQSSSHVFAAGGGVDLALAPHFAVKFDLQGQRYATPVTTSGHIYPVAGTVGLVYRFGSASGPN